MAAVTVTEKDKQTTLHYAATLQTRIPYFTTLSIFLYILNLVYIRILDTYAQHMFWNILESLPNRFSFLTVQYIYHEFG